MNVLAIDYGLSHVGIALAVDSSLAEPLATLKKKNDEQMISELSRLIDNHHIDLVVMGLPKGKLVEVIKVFAMRLKEVCKISVVFIDEDFTSKQAQFHARQAGKKRSKIKHIEHQWAATIILQNYLDQNV